MRLTLRTTTFPALRSFSTTPKYRFPDSKMSAEEQKTQSEPQPVISEGLTEQAKKAEPDAAEEVKEMEKKGMDNLPTRT